MNIINNYEGASIDILTKNEKNNTIYLSLKEEKDKFSHYYNFVVENNEEKDGEIHIKNISSSQYYKKGTIDAPYIKTDYWRKLEKEEFYINEKEELVIKIKTKVKAEISLVPRYVEENLKKFIEKTNNGKLKVRNEPIDEIIIGNTKLPAIIFTARQHPGETLSSFFIEGVIEEILSHNELLDRYCFVIYPIVSKEGVRNGNHRYTNGIDYNRSWNKKDAPEEIKYIKEQLKKFNIKFFIDVHNDEVTKENYIRTSYKDMKKDRIAGIRVLQNQSKFRRFVRALIKQRKLINIFSQTANQYIFEKYHCNTILVEITMNEEYKNVNQIGKIFIKEVIGE